MQSLPQFFPRRRFGRIAPFAATSRFRGFSSVLGSILAGAASFSFAIHAEAALSASSVDRKDLSEMSLEQLSGIVVTSVSKRAEKLSAAPASIFVISADDIRRSGAMSLPEALRLAPNLDVARVDANQYAISARGFNSITANRMLVLIDGRAVYSPLFAGVFWDAQHVMLEDVERIEVISGPGTALWGANAVNGVINVITRSAQETQGALVSATAGTHENDLAARYGAPLGERGHFRVFARHGDREHTSRENGTDIRDASRRTQGGFRADWVEASRALTLQGDAYTSTIDQVPAAREISGSNILLRWNEVLEDGSRWRLQTYMDRTDRRSPTVYDDALTTFDIDFLHTLPQGKTHTLLWGGGYRRNRDRFENAAQLLLPADKDLRLSNLFVKDIIALKEDLELTVGARLERNDYTGTEFLPNARISWRRDEEMLLWGALSRSLRTPSRVDRDYYSASIVGGSDFRSEVATVIETGIRAQPSMHLTYSVTAFHHHHEKLRSAEPKEGRLIFENRIEGTSSGIEAWGTYQVSKYWRIAAGTVWLHQDLKPTADSRDTGFGVVILGNDPKSWSSIRSSWDLSPRHELDVNLRHVGARANPQVPSYVALDARLGWRLAKDVEVSLLLQNLLDARHAEWGNPANRAEYERGAFLKVVWRP
jgi:iron complex outermembrane receptor protein